MAPSLPTLATHPRRRAPSLRLRATRWLAMLLLMVASPCATELALGSVAAAFSGDDVAIDACCPDRNTPDGTTDDGEREPDTRRATCGCCHSFEPSTFTPAFVSLVSIAAPRAPDPSAGETIDGHAEPPFRPPARA